MLPHAFGLRLDDSMKPTAPASPGRPAAGKDAAGKVAGAALAALSLAEDRLSAGGDRHGLGFGAAAAGPMPESPEPNGKATMAGTVQDTAELDSAEEQLQPAKGAEATGPPVQLSAEVAAALLARLRFRRHLHQVRRCCFSGEHLLYVVRFIRGCLCSGSAHLLL